MEIAAIVISLVAVLVAATGSVRSELRWRAERRSDIRVMTRHDGMGIDVYAADAVETEHVIAVRVFNYGGRPEHVMWVGLESLTGEALVDDKPHAAKLVDAPPPESRELPPRGQIAADFKLPGEAIEDGFIGYAVLGTGERVRSVPAGPDPGIREFHDDVQRVVSEMAERGELPPDRLQSEEPPDNV